METTQEAVLVTGGASGIGLAVVRGLLDAGRRCWWPTFRRSGWTAWAISRRPKLGRVRLDVSDEAQVVDAGAAGERGPIGGLVNSAGIGTCRSWTPKPRRCAACWR